ncbi:MAG: NADH:flavin oxidoreductase/NADH oxidase [Corynebacterium sp.]|uniref:NADH:flavin oxidoreductase/NADH oxidase n=1 Tax=uncultured Corynebacterium sp. TaxID=159447 RepID=UPI001854AF9E|nr:NADH:flavin oxidoreductase/NADH oxidase [uncultured Corynebacterium sp.]NLZ57443.1 NADH:flavin oxidoreductase/NADH oxidase [Corynebacterium sp.]
MTSLFSPLQLRGLTVRNRVWLAPMCQYQVTAHDGIPEDWHTVHYGARAVGGFGLIVTEATGVSPEARISPACTGLWNDDQVLAWKGITDFAHSQGAVIGVQLNHAGRKAGTYPWLPGQPSGTIPLGEGGWETHGPSALPQQGLGTPREMTLEDIRKVIADFAQASRRAVDAGFDTIEVHGAHGYLLHQFLTPLANKRSDDYGGSFENRTRLIREIVMAIRAEIPEEMPLLVRLSATDWIGDEPSWDLEQTVRLVAILKDLGVDVVDISTGGASPARIPVRPGYQVPFAARVKKEVGISTSTVGLITEAHQAQQLLDEGQADIVSLGRAALRDPSWPQRAAHELGLPSEETPFPTSYWRAAWPK